MGARESGREGAREGGREGKRQFGIYKQLSKLLDDSPPTSPLLLSHFFP